VGEQAGVVGGLWPSHPFIRRSVGRSGVIVFGPAKKVLRDRRMSTAADRTYLWPARFAGRPTLMSPLPAVCRPPCSVYIYIPYVWRTLCTVQGQPDQMPVAAAVFRRVHIALRLWPHKCYYAFYFAIEADHTTSHRPSHCIRFVF